VITDIGEKHFQFLI